MPITCGLLVGMDPKTIDYEELSRTHHDSDNFIYLPIAVKIQLFRLNKEDPKVDFVFQTSIW